MNETDTDDLYSRNPSAVQVMAFMGRTHGRPSFAGMRSNRMKPAKSERACCPLSTWPRTALRTRRAGPGWARPRRHWRLRRRTWDTPPPAHEMCLLRHGGLNKPSLACMAQASSSSRAPTRAERTVFTLTKVTARESTPLMTSSHMLPAHAHARRAQAHAPGAPGRARAARSAGPPPARPRKRCRTCCRSCRTAGPGWSAARRSSCSASARPRGPGRCPACARRTTSTCDAARGAVAAQSARADRRAARCGNGNVSSMAWHSARLVRQRDQHGMAWRARALSRPGCSWAARTWPPAAAGPAWSAARASRRARPRACPLAGMQTR